MNEHRSTLERELDRLSPPRIPLDQLVRRRDRKHRNQRIRAGALGLGIAIAVGWLGVNAIRSTPPGPADPSEELGIFAPVAGRIVFQDDGLRAVDPNSPSVSTLVRSGSEGDIPLGWSSDGTELLFMRQDHDTPFPYEDELFILHADGSETRLNIDTEYIEGATIAPDGSQVVFAAAGGPYFPYNDPTKEPGLFAIDTDGGRPVAIPYLPAGNPVSSPTFSPDGTQIAYLVTGFEDDVIDVWVADVDGSNAHEILADEPAVAEGVSSLAWSPSGDRIAMHNALGRVLEIYTFAPDGSDFTTVITGGMNPVWSPDGTQIAYMVPYDPPPGVGPSGLAIANADGSNVREFGFAMSGPWHPGTPIEEAPPSEIPTPTPTSAALRGDGEVIVLEQLGTGAGWDLAAQEPETGEIRKIVETDGTVDCPDLGRCANFITAAEWSSDGRWVAFMVSISSLDPLVAGPCGPTVGVWVQSATGEPRQLTTPCDAPRAGPPQELWAWSPAGDRLAYARVEGDSDELFVIDPEDGRHTSVGTADGEMANLAWSPDGTRIAYSDDGSVYVVEADGGERTLLADSIENVVDIEWSPDGTQMSVLGDVTRSRIQVMDADGSDLHVAFEGEDACCSAAWSPNGDRILYMLTIERPGDPDGETEVWTVSPDGSNRIKVFDSNGCDMGEIVDALPVWAPNGTQVAYYACGTWVVANADGTGETQPINELVHRSWGGGGLEPGWPEG